MTTRIPVADLSYGVLDEISRDIDWSEAAGEDGDGYDYWEAFDYAHTADDGTEHELVLVSNRSSVVAVFLADGTRIDPNDPSDYFVALDVACRHCGKALESNDGVEFVDFTHDRDSEQCLLSRSELHEPSTLVLSATDLDQLRDVEPYQHGAEGPMMNYWYSLGDGRYGSGAPSIGGYEHRTDEIGAAYRLRAVSLCLVEVDGTFGLALTGGGMDLTWSIVEAFTLLGYLPPARFCRPPGFGDRNQDYLVAAMHRSLTSLVERYQRDADELVQKYPTLAQEAQQ